MSKITWQTEFTVPPDDSEGVCGIKFEDSGCAAIMYQSFGEEPDHEFGGDDCFYVRLHSWDDENDETAPRGRYPNWIAKTHTLFRSLMGRKIRVTVETVDDDTPQ